jgi:hypothetical protein
MIMRSRPANIRLINRRSRLLRLLLALSSGNENENYQNNSTDLAQLTRSLHIRPESLVDCRNSPNNGGLDLHESAFRSNQSPQSGPTMSVGAPSSFCQNECDRTIVQPCLRSVPALLCHRTQAFGETNLYLLEKLLEVGEGHRRIVVVIGRRVSFAPFNLHKVRVRRATGFLLTASPNARPDPLFRSTLLTNARLRKSTSVIQTQFMSGKVPFWRELQRLFSQPICGLKDLLLSRLVYFRQVTGCRRPRLAVEHRGFRNLTQSRSIRRRSS